jgi:hypothetical protein
MILLLKSVFLAVNAGLRWFNNVTDVYLVQVFLLLIGLQGWRRHFFRYRPLLRGWLEVCANFTPTLEETTNTAQPHLVQ